MPQIDDAKRGMNDFTDLWLRKLGNLPAGVGVVGQPLHLLQDEAYELLTYFRNAKLRLVVLDALQVMQRRPRNNKFHLISAEYFPGLIQSDGVALPNIS